MHLVLLIVLFVYISLLGVHCELLAVVQLFRHGHRTPLYFYKNDPYSDLSTYWGGLDYGQLTNEGKRQHYSLGQYTRSRYPSFIPERYNRSFFYAQTTDVDRTHMSAQTNIYGLFPVRTIDQIWRKNVDWQAIPIHPADSSIWSSLDGPENCEAYNTHLANVLNSTEYQKIDEEYSAMYKYLTEYSGSKVTSFKAVDSIWDPLRGEDFAGFILPSWTKLVYPEPLRTLNGLIFEFPTHTTPMKRLVVGPLLNEIVEYLELVAADPTSSQKYKMYSGHDTNIAAILNAFGAFDPPYPPEFASSIYIELHLESWENVVKVFSKNGDTITQISVNGCNLTCRLAEFRYRLSDIIVDVPTRNEECNQVTTT